MLIRIQLTGTGATYDPMVANTRNEQVAAMALWAYLTSRRLHDTRVELTIRRIHEGLIEVYTDGHRTLEGLVEVRADGREEVG